MVKQAEAFTNRQVGTIEESATSCNHFRADDVLKRAIFFIYRLFLRSHDLFGKVQLPIHLADADRNLVAAEVAVEIRAFVGLCRT